MNNNLLYYFLPQEAVTDPTDHNFVERVYCNHLFHYGCLDKYMKTPPFQGTCFINGKQFLKLKFVLALSPLKYQHRILNTGIWVICVSKGANDKRCPGNLKADWLCIKPIYWDCLQCTSVVLQFWFWVSFYSPLPFFCFRFW